MSTDLSAIPKGFWYMLGVAFVISSIGIVIISCRAYSIDICDTRIQLADIATQEQLKNYELHAIFQYQNQPETTASTPPLPINKKTINFVQQKEYQFDQINSELNQIRTKLLSNSNKQ